MDLHLSPGQLAVLRAAVLAEDARRSGSRSLAAFAKQAWPIFDPTPLVWGWHLDALCDHLEAVARGEIKRLIINVPPRSGKSNFFAICWPAWVWAWAPATQFMFLSYSSSLSVEHSVKCRQVIESQWYQERFPRGWHIADDQNTKHDFVNTMGGRRRATSIPGGITGHGGDIVAIDDPLNAEDATSEAELTRAARVCIEAVGTRLNDPKTGRAVLTMQRLSVKDPTQEFLSMGGWEHLVIPMEHERARSFVTHREVLGTNGRSGEMVREEFQRDPRTAEGQLLIPDRLPAETIVRMKAGMHALKWAGQFQQRPAPMEGHLFKLRDWRFWQGDEGLSHRLGYSLHPRRPEGCVRAEDAPARPLRLEDLDEMILSVDPSFRKTDDGSFVAIHVWGKLGARRLLLYRVHRRMDFTDTVTELLRVIEMFPEARRKLIEGKANGDAIISTLERNHSVYGLEAVPVTHDKMQRAMAMTPYHTGHNVELPEGAEWTDEYVTQHAEFPNGASDDDVDAQSQGLQGLEREETAWDRLERMEEDPYV